MSNDQTNKAPPAGWPRVAPGIFYDDAAKAISWLCEAFGFEVRLKLEGEGGSINHSELTLGEGVFMVSSAGRLDSPNPPKRTSPRSIDGANTQALCVYIDDVDKHHARAVAAGANIVDAPITMDYGPTLWSDRLYRVIDLEGHNWWFMQRLRG